MSSEEGDNEDDGGGAVSVPLLTSFFTFVVSAVDDFSSFSARDCLGAPFA
eukprot:CAMPEP_0196589774 /NCGR_PEP_ID=MMETSP1081-20130531/64593_1 /TAXON_ID=36882 /ORGANISM="Pyramimonas amylifera, Strain CCMP720" /LENGTH=49 /DNA_ID= /DNA_START= /DNA_END= /DNA_ORIENTATION=